MVWNRRCLARTCLRAVDIDRTEGGASSGMGVDVPLSTKSASASRPKTGRDLALTLSPLDSSQEKDDWESLDDGGRHLQSAQT
jgi:hypothetical protein